VDELWQVLLDLGDTLTAPWVLVGGQMVLLHALEHGQVPPQISQDADIVADIRALPTALRTIVAALTEYGFMLDGISPDGIAHRYVRAASEPGGGSPKVAVDLLAPEGIGDRADLTTEQGRTIQVPGGSQAIERAELLAVTHAGRTGTIPRPALLGAIIIKAAACGLPDDVARHLRDLALLTALVDDPFVMRDELTPKDRQRLKGAAVLADYGHPAWSLVPASIRRQGQIAYAVLTELP
jgi:hypothetical protein